MRSKIFTLFAVLMIASLVLAACQPAAAPAPAQAEPKKLRYNLGPGDVPTLDPALSTDTSSTQIASLTFVGLTKQDEVTTEIGPGMATEWSVSPDGLVYTFKLRNDVPWVEYDAVTGEVVQVMDCQETPAPRMVTAYDFEYGILRTLAPATASDYAYVLGFALKGGDAYNGGETDDPTTVGVKAVDDWTLQLTFNEAAAYNANIAGMWVAYAQPKWLIEGDDCSEGRGDRWTETGFFQGYGPYVLKEWVHDSFVTIIKNPFWPGTDNIPAAKIDEVTLTMLDDAPALAEYEAANLDVSLVPLSDIDRVKADATLSKELSIAPDLCTYYYGFNTKAPVVEDVRVRRALSMALDRQSLVDNVTKGGQEPAQWFSRPGLAGAPTMDTHPDLGIKYDTEAAKAELDAYLSETGQTAADLDLTIVFNTSSGHQKIAEAIQQMWKDNLGLDVKLVNQEWKVYLDTVKSKDTPQIWRLGWCQDYPDANNFIRENFSVNGSANPAEAGEPYGGINWNNPTFEKLVKDAAVEMDPVKRLEMYAEAEEILVYEDAAIIPIYWYTRVSVTKPRVERTYSVLGGMEAFNKWDVK